MPNCSPHPLLTNLMSYLCELKPNSAWLDQQSLAVGIATPLEGQWLIATKQQGHIECRISTERPVSPRAAMVLDGTSADLLLQGTLGSPLHVRGDKTFLEEILSGGLSQ